MNLEFPTLMETVIRSEAPSYRLVQLIGQGLTSCVYRAERIDSRAITRQTVALKVLKSEKSVQWLKQEFELLLKLRSPYCANVLGWENLPEGPALVLEFVEGVTLQDLVVDSALDPELTDEITAQIQLGLADLGREGLFHGDLSLRNVMVDRLGRIRLIDFGNRPVESESAYGTPAYAAPEIWCEGRGSLASDLFSLGLIRRDLIGGLPSSHTDNIFWRQRCERAIGSSCSLLERVPDQRRFLPLASRYEQSRKLADLVCRLLRERGERSFQTQSLCLSKLNSTHRPSAPSSAGKWINRLDASKRYREVLCSGLVGLFVFLLARPVSSLQIEAAVPAESAGLEVRTLRWVHLSVNGRVVGYTPIGLIRLRPGRHRLSWRDHSGTGEIVMELQQGERKRLSDMDFRLPRVGTRAKPDFLFH